MQTNAIQGGAGIAPTRTEREQFIGDFNAALTDARSKSDSTASVGKTPQEELHEWLQKTPAEHMRDAVLKEMGLSEDDLAKMTPEQRAAVEKEIAERIEQKLAEAGGQPNPQQVLANLLAMTLPGIQGTDSGKSAASDENPLVKLIAGQEKTKPIA